MHPQKVAILDAGSQYGKLIDRKVRELFCETDILPLDTPSETLKRYNAIIISGGPNTLKDKDAPKCDPAILQLNLPILGICYGMQWLGLVFGSQIMSGDVREDGQIEISICEGNYQLFEELDKKEKVLLTHGDSVTNLGSELVVLAKSEHSISAIKHKDKPYYGVQFHPEVDLTPKGKVILSNFLFKIAKLYPIFSLDNRLDNLIEEIRRTTENKHVVILVSGGVDSTVCCALLYKAIGEDRLHAFHIDHGLMRYEESALVEISLKKIGFKLKTINAWQNFKNATTEIKGKTTNKLCESVHPEEKRKIIGDTFMRVIFSEIENLGLKDFILSQGTLRPDLIESASSYASSKADVIKTHHNDTELVRKKREEGLIIEPLKDYHKDEVRKLGKMLGLPDELVYRHPFPGPGLGIRILCSEKAFMDENYDEVKEKLNLICKEKNVRCLLLPIKTVGVQGDGRTYSYAAAINGELEWPNFFEVAKEITRNIHKINRVIYCFNELKEEVFITKTLLTEENLETLRKADYIFNQALFKFDNGATYSKISQIPIVLLPISLNNDGKRSIAIRTFITNDFMTGIPAIPGIDISTKFIKEVSEELKRTDGISAVFYDLTSKPPSTTEWE